MNKAITDGLVFTPTAFESGLDVWSSGNGIPGSDTYDGAANAAYVPADADFSGCLELIKTDNTQMLRYMGQTPIVPGCYLQITARVKAISGNLPSVRIAGYALNGSDNHVSGLTEVGSSTTLTTYGDVYEITAIVGTGARGGVDMVWGTDAVSGHFGLDLTGSNGGVVRIDDIQIEDVTSFYADDKIGVVDVVDYGALGDGSTDDSDAFDAADAAANGRTILVPEGTYYLGSNTTIQSPIRFVGNVTCDDSVRLELSKSFDLPTYIDAFGDEELGFKKALQCMMNFSDHESLDMCGRRISVTEPIDVHAAVNNKTSYELRRVLRNGEFDVVGGTAWDPTVVSSAATYSVSNSLVLTNVTNIANIEPGSIITGTGVGREVYVTSVDVGAQTLVLSNALYDAAGTQIFTFTRHKYILDFNGFSKHSKMVIEDLDFRCNGEANGVILASNGIITHFKDCFFTRPAYKGITSPGRGCQGMLIDRCQFLSNEGSTNSQDRVSIAYNSNANDVKVRDNRCELLGMFGVMSGSGHQIAENHWFNGDNVNDGLRLPGVVLTMPNCKTLITGNYIDNGGIEWSNEHDAAPEFSNEFAFGSLTISNNIFYASNVASFYTFISVRPVGPDHYIQGLNVIGNTFKVLQGNIDRVDKVDTTFYDMNYAAMRNIQWEGNTYNGVNTSTANPVYVGHTQSTASTTWTIDSDERLPFEGYSRKCSSVVFEGDVTNSSNVKQVEYPSVVLRSGSNQDQVQLRFSTAVKGTVFAGIRCDNPV